MSSKRTASHEVEPYTTSSKVAAEFFGTLWLVLGGVGAAVLAGDQIGNAGIALAFGLAVLSAAYAVGHVSGGHFNPAVTLGVALAGRMSWREVPAYVVSQVVGAVVGVAAVLAVAEGKPGWSRAEGLGANGWGSGTPGGYAWWAAALVEVLLTAVFLLVILGTTGTDAPRGFAPLAIGLALTLIHLVSIPVDSTSVNPARSLGSALLSGGTALQQVWLFIVFPLVGAAIAGVLHGRLLGRRPEASMQDAERA